MNFRSVECNKLSARRRRNLRRKDRSGPRGLLSVAIHHKNPDLLLTSSSTVQDDRSINGDYRYALK